MRTVRLPQSLDDLEKLADFVLAQARDLDTLRAGWRFVRRRHLDRSRSPPTKGPRGSGAFGWICEESDYFPDPQGD